MFRRRPLAPLMVTVTSNHGLITVDAYIHNGWSCRHLIPVICGSIIVNPGDILFGDDDGIIVTTIKELDALIPAAEDIQRSEDRLLQEMANGVSLLEMLNFEEHCTNIHNGKGSQLRFQV